jgi:hypothetical protein
VQVSTGKRKLFRTFLVPDGCALRIYRLRYFPPISRATFTPTRGLLPTRTLSRD